MTSSAIIAIAAALAISISTIGPGIGQGIAASRQWRLWLASRKW